MLQELAIMAWPMVCPLIVQQSAVTILCITAALCRTIIEVFHLNVHVMCYDACCPFSRAVQLLKREAAMGFSPCSTERT